MMSEQFDRMGFGYEESLRTHPSVRQGEQEALLADLEPGHNVLDFAAGSGFLTLPAARRVGLWGRVVAVDSSAVMLGFLRQKIDPGAAVQVMQTADPTLSALPAASFDRVYSLGGFHHVEDQVTVVRGLYRVLKPGGTATVMDFTDTTPAQRHFDTLVHAYNPTGHAALFLSESRAVNLGRFAGCPDTRVIARRFSWRFRGLDDAAEFFVCHHGLRCPPDEAARLIRVNFPHVNALDRPLELPFDYTQLVLSKPAPGSGSP